MHALITRTNIIIYNYLNIFCMNSAKTDSYNYMILYKFKVNSRSKCLKIILTSIIVIIAVVAAVDGIVNNTMIDFIYFKSLL